MDTYYNAQLKMCGILYHIIKWTTETDKEVHQLRRDSIQDIGELSTFLNNIGELEQRMASEVDFKNW